MKIRAEVAADRAAVARVVGQAFGRDAEARLVALIREREEALVSLVAEVDGRVVGHVLVSPITLAADGKFAGVAPLAVSPDYQGEGVGAALMGEVATESGALGIDALFLLGDPRYYSRFGYVQSHVGNDYGATDSFQHLELKSGCLDGVSEVAHYVSAFNEVGS